MHRLLLPYALVPWLVCGTVQCSRGDDTSGAGPQVQPLSPPGQADAGSGLRAGRRPERSYVLAYGAKQCVIYSEKGDDRSAPQVVHCPRELQQGERIRLSGRVCFREGDSRERDAPVRCPVDLVALEQADRTDAGL